MSADLVDVPALVDAEPLPEVLSEGIEAVLETERLADEGMTMMVVTHEMGFAREVGSRLIFMDDGKIVEDGDPRQIFSNPSDPRCKAFLSHVL